MRFRTALGCAGYLALLLANGCASNAAGVGPGSAGVAGAPSGGNPANSSAGTPTVPPTAEQQEEFRQLKLALDESKTLDAAGLLAKHAVRAVSALSYDPRASEFLDRIQASALALSEDELSHLGTNGFVISARSAFPTFVRGYAAIYSSDLPVYISADAILEAVHASYDAVLKLTEEEALLSNLTQLLGSVHARLPQLAAANPARAADVDVYLAVARSLLLGAVVAPVAGGDPNTVGDLYQLAIRAGGPATVTLFGEAREIDPSQFKPRGHYADDPRLSQYFRTMIWLGRSDFRLIETKSDGSTQFMRPQYDAMLLLREAMSDADLSIFQKIDAALQAFVGESDYMTVPQIDLLIADLGGADKALAADDATVEAKVRAGGYGLQRIASQIMRNDGAVDTLPLARSFALFGQRYVLDSHVFSQVVYDRLPSRRMMPDPLDVAYAALKNDQALPLLSPGLSAFEGYPSALEGARVLSDAHGADFWSANLYNLWLSSLRALSPASDVSQPSALGMPQVTGTEPWGRRILNTQLGSWAELRHDTLLYAKQSYTGVPSCNYPDAYVDPYPEFYQRLRLFAEHGLTLVDLLDGTSTLDHTNLRSYFTTLSSTLGTLGAMATNERSGTPFTAEQMAFVNNAVRIVKQNAGCTTVEAPDGWLASLYLVPQSAIEASPTIADVHTEPADEAGNDVGKVLHVATGYPRMMVTTVDTCQGPRAYVGVAFAYQEQVTTKYQRLTDAEWVTQLGGAGTVDVPWMTPLIGH